ncbi:MAG: hypothetical protein Q8Q86_02960, partial [Candidatus Daviesbacteria bacterium]|nr:hypothetical protein [Candidatus Daviesbacteria bacterium]
MILPLVSILAFAITAGQLIKVPIGIQGITALDITIALFCLIGLLKLKFHLKKPPKQITAAFIFIFVATVSLLLTPLSLSLSEYFLGFSYTIRFSLYVLFAWLVAQQGVYSTFSNAFGALQKDPYRIFLLSGISFAVLGILQFIFFPDLDFLRIAGWDPHYFRTVSTFLDPNFAGAFLVLTLILIFQNLAKAKKWNTIFFITIYLALLTTFSRSSYLMFLVSGLTLSFLKKS